MSPARRPRAVCIDQIHGLPASFSIHSGPDSSGPNASHLVASERWSDRKIWCCDGLLQPPVMKNLRRFLHQKCRHFGRIDHSESRRDCEFPRKVVRDGIEGIGMSGHFRLAPKSRANASSKLGDFTHQPPEKSKVLVLSTMTGPSHGTATSKSPTLRGTK